MRTIWVCKGTPSPPVKPSGLPRESSLYNDSRTHFESYVGGPSGGPGAGSSRAAFVFLNRPYVDRIITPPTKNAPAEHARRHDSTSVTRRLRARSAFT